MQEIVEGVSFIPVGESEYHVLINHGPDKGVMFKFGRVWFKDEDEPVLSFDYDIVSEQKPIDADAFRNVMGAVLQSSLLKAIGEGTATYTGGVDVAEGTVEEPKPTIFDKPVVDSKILTPWDYKLPTPEPGTKMSRNLLDGSF